MKLNFRSVTWTKKTILLSVLIGFVLIGLVYVGTIFSKGKIQDLPDIINEGRITVVIDSTSIGFSVVGDSVSGFQYEIVKLFADSLGVELVVAEENDLKAAIVGVENGDYQLIADFVPVTTEWQNNVLFTVPLLSSRQVLVQHIIGDSLRDIAITKQTYLNNDTVYVPVHSPNIMILKHLSDQIADSIHVLELDLSTEQIVRLVANKKIKYTICSDLFAKKLKLKYPTIDVSLPIGFQQQQAWAVSNKSPLLLNKLNEFLSDFIGSSAYWQIYRKYY